MDLSASKAQTFTKQVFFNYIKECDIKHPELVYKQACHETGWFTSLTYRQDNNLFGFRLNNKYIHFTHWKECVRYYKKYQKRKLKKDEDYYKFLVRIKYAEDSNYCQKLRQIKFKL